MKRGAKTKGLGGYHLEYAQRDYWGIIDEPMAFSEETIAKVIDAIKDNCDDTGDRLFLAALARTLRGTDNQFRLRLSGTKRRPFQPVDEHDKLMVRRRHVAAVVQWREQQGDPKEAAVAFACAQFKLSRAKIFDLLKEEAEWQKILDSFGNEISDISLAIKKSQ